MVDMAYMYSNMGMMHMSVVDMEYMYNDVGLMLMYIHGRHGIHVQRHGDDAYVLG